MRILLVHQGPIPVFAYGGTERVVWDLGRALVDAGHQVAFAVPKGSACPFAEVIPFAAPHWQQALSPSVLAGFDVLHFHFHPEAQPLGAGSDAPDFGLPYVVTQHGNAAPGKVFPRNTVFLSRQHASLYGSDVFVHNGLDWREYGPVDLQAQRKHYHFLGKAAWRVKNVAGAIAVARKAGVELDVLGGHRLNWRRGFRFTASPRVHFYGMVGGVQKHRLLQHSRGLIFPVRWHEPFGLAVIESLYFGCPVFGTPYGALPELVDGACGVLANSAQALAAAVQAHAQGALTLDSRACHARALDHFAAKRMALDYVAIYERVLAGESLHAVPPRSELAFAGLPWGP